jgi:hypothetical protein
MDITKGSRAKLECPVGCMDVPEGSRAEMGCQVGYMEVTEGVRAVLEYPIGLHGYHGELNLAKDPSVMPHYKSVLLIIRPKKPVMAQSLFSKIPPIDAIYRLLVNRK